MSKFNKEALSELINKAKGERSLNHYAQASDVDAGYLSRIVNMRRENPPSPEILKKLAEKAHNSVKYEDFMRACGYFAQAIDIDIKEIYVKENSSTEYMQRAGRGSRAIANLKPVLGTIKAGLPILAEDNWEEEIEVPSNFKADFALRVEGDSMIYIGIHPGDIALFVQTQQANNGQIVAAGLEGDVWKANLKFYIKTNGSSYLRSANPDYEDIKITDKHKIIGVLVGIIKEPPSLQDYQALLNNKEYTDKQWIEVIEHATAHGIDALQLKQLVEFHSFMVRQGKK